MITLILFPMISYFGYCFVTLCSVFVNINLLKQESARRHRITQIF